MNHIKDLKPNNVTRIVFTDKSWVELTFKNKKLICIKDSKGYWEDREYDVLDNMTYLMNNYGQALL
jgi:hypothetical protein